MGKAGWLWFAFLAAVGGCGGSGWGPTHAQAPQPGGEGPVTRPATAQATAPLEIVERRLAADALLVRLSNGLTVIVSENHNAPVVCVRAYVRAGGLFEGEYLGSGISHLCEHLVAEGARHEGARGAGGTRGGPGRIDRIGGQSNAYTCLDHTCYYVAASAGKTDECIDLIAEWMARAEITVEDFRREHGVVRRELEMGRDNPGRQMSLAHMRNLYGTHPAAVPVIGYEAPLAALRYEDVLAYHRRMYVPQNMVVVVVGDVDTAAVLERVRRAFAGLAAGRTPELTVPPVPPVSAGRRSVVVHKTLTEAVERIGFQSIPLLHEDLYALDVLSYILTRGESSRLVEAVRRRRRLVTSISSHSWTPGWGKGEFMVAFRARPNLVDAAEQAVLDELRKVAAEGVTEAELARAKRQKVADFVYSQQTVQSQAARLGMDYLSTGDVEFSRRYTERIQQVTAAQVGRVAKKYLDCERAVITRMLPAGSARARRARSRPTSRAATSFFRLPNGLRVVLHPTKGVGLVSMALVTRGGLLAETPATNGMGALMTALSTKGAGDLSAEDIAAFFDGAGGSISARCGTSAFCWQATVLADSFPRALEIFADVVQRPTFPDKELQILRPVALARIRRIGENWLGQLQQRFRRDFFRDSPLAMMAAGREEVVSSATSRSLAAYHRAHVKAGASVLAIYGNFDAARTRRRVKALFGAMGRGDYQPPDHERRKVAPGGERYVHATRLKGSGVVVAAPGMRLTALRDRLAMAVLDTIISGYRLPRGWLHDELRGRRLVYVVHAYNWTSLVPGAFVVYAHCEPDKVEQVARIIRADLRRTLTHRFTAREVELAVNMILTAELLAKQQMSALAMQAALDELHGFGYDFRKRYEKLLRAVTPEDVSRVARKYLAGGYVTTIVTPHPELLTKQGK